MTAICLNLQVQAECRGKSSECRGRVAHEAGTRGEGKPQKFIEAHEGQEQGGRGSAKKILSALECEYNANSTGIGKARGGGRGYLLIL